MTTLNVSIPTLVSRFKGKVFFTLGLVMAESILGLFFPLFIGFAINDLLDDSLEGTFLLAGLGIASLIVGSGRRFFDTRAYSAIYVKISSEMVAKEQARESSLSKISARASLLTEFIEFLENSLPMIVESIIGVLGVLVIIFILNLTVFWACVVLLLLMAAIYLLSGKRNYRLNESYNNEIENQVAVLTGRNMDNIRKHFKAIAYWNTKLSDLETWNFFALWFGIIAVLAITPMVVITSGVINYGKVFSLLMYVFQYAESLVALPYFIQQTIRLREISARLQS